MKRLIAVLFSLAVLCVAAQAQTPAPAPAQHFVISANAAGYGDAKGTSAVSLAGAAFQVTANVSAGYLQVFNPSDSTQPKYHLGVLNYTRELQSLIGTKLSSKLVFDTTNWLVTFQAGGGKVTYAGANHIAEVGGVFLTRPVANNLSLTCGYQILHGQGTSIITRNNSFAPSVGLNFTF